MLQHIKRCEQVDVEVSTQFRIGQRLNGALLPIAGIVDGPINDTKGLDSVCA